MTPKRRRLSGTARRLVAVGVGVLVTLYVRLLGGGTNPQTIKTDALEGLLRQRGDIAADASAREFAANPKSENFVVVDVRSDAEVKVSVIPGAITKRQFECRRGRYANQLVITYCTVGIRSEAYARKLVSQGVQVKNYEGSILQWVRAGLPLETLDGKPTTQVHTYSRFYRVPEPYVKVTK